MSTTIKQEYFNWIESLDSTFLNEIDCKLLNLLVSNFSTFLPLSTAGGSRGKKIAELIQKSHANLSSTFPKIESSETTATVKETKIGSLKIGPFRGFSRSECFVFDKKYTFMYGPNGSGKSSFCEGLEYALLGDIEEANAKRISVSQYIKNAQQGNGVEPEAYKSDGKTLIKKNQSYYRFAFIEKNRIDGFARLAATTSSVQKDRIAILFGLEAFSIFVDGFTDDISKYLSLTNIQKESFQKEIQKNTDNQVNIDRNNNKLNEIEKEIKHLITEAGQEELTTLEELIVFLMGVDNASGHLSELRQYESQKIPDDINLAEINSLESDILRISTDVNVIMVKLSELAQLSTNVNYKYLYDAIEAIGKSGGKDTRICPACKTPLSNTTVNPFEHAVIELENLKSLSALQESVQLLGKSLSKNIQITISIISSINSSCQQTKYEGRKLPLISSFVFTDIQSINTWLPQLEMDLLTIMDYSDNLQEMKEHFSKYNNDLSDKRKFQSTVTERIRKFSYIYTKSIELNTIIRNLRAENNSLQKAIDEFSNTNTSILQAIDDEDREIAIRYKFADSYIKLITNLKAYRDQLPSNYSMGLSAKVKEYYNKINEHDPEFEKMDKLILPVMSDNKIEIVFVGDENKHDALNILSEGHIKVLGLSILLAKAESEKLGFLIFDDIVNAIDDDHRDGVAELLMCHKDMRDLQIIVTCHGETFINKLEHKLGASEASKNVNNIQFVPPDIVKERGVQVSIGSFKHYLLKAEEYWKVNNLKDSATECRRAVESISIQLWKKLDKHLKINLQVTMKSPNSTPDLRTVVDGLLGVLRKISGTEDLQIKISQLITKYEWSLLNKGVHEEDDYPEFERKDIEELIKLIKAIENLIGSIKLEVVALN